MFKNKVFWNAFLDGLAAPWSFWGPRPDYTEIARIPTVAETFERTGAYLSASYGVNVYEHPGAAPTSAGYIHAAE